MIAACLLDRPAGASGIPFQLAAPSISLFEEALSHARRAGRESLGEGRDPFGPLAESEGLWPLRVRLARAATALARDEPAAARAAVAGLDASPLGLPDLPGWIALSTASPDPVALARFAATARPEPVGRAALLLAARTMRTLGERDAVRAAFTRWRASTPQGVRAEAAAAIIENRLNGAGEAAETPFRTLATLFPDAPERAPDLFPQPDRDRFIGAVRHGPPDLRLARARAIVTRNAGEALDLVRELPRSPANRLAILEIAVTLGQVREARKLLDHPERLVFEDPDTNLHIAVLRCLNDMRLSLEPQRVPPRRGKRGKRRAPTPPPAVPEGVSQRHMATVDALLAQPQLTEIDRRRLLDAAARFLTRAQGAGAALKYIEPLVRELPGAATGSDELFVEAFARYRSGSPDDLIAAARALDRQASLYREPAVRRRALYWSARARQRLGETLAARNTFASLLPGAAPDLYARWAAEALGITLKPGPATEGTAEPPFRVSPVSAGRPSRELLTCGFPDLAEDAAEAEGSMDPVFAAVLAAERDDYRKSTNILKSRFPALGTPEEGDIPLRIRRAYYPLAQADLVTRTARQFGLPPALVFGLIRQESIFQPVVRSHAGAVGLMQVMPATGRSLLRQERRRGKPNLHDPEENLRLGARYLAQMLRLFDGNVPAALAAYNAGPGRVLRWRRQGPALEPDEFVETIPITEPRIYVKKVLYFEAAYRSLYGDLQ